MILWRIVLYSKNFSSKNRLRNWKRGWTIRKRLQRIQSFFIKKSLSSFSRIKIDPSFLSEDFSPPKMKITNRFGSKDFQKIWYKTQRRYLTIMRKLHPSKQNSRNPIVKFLQSYPPIKKPEKLDLLFGRN